jgi:hypothetical protein
MQLTGSEAAVVVNTRDAAAITMGPAAAGVAAAVDLTRFAVGEFDRFDSSFDSSCSFRLCDPAVTEEDDDAGAGRLISRADSDVRTV